MATGREIIKVSCLRHIYPDRTQVYLCGLDFVVHEGERVVILGPNGSGKSTLLHHLLGLLTPHEGSVEVFGHHPATEYEKIRSRIGVLLQDVNDQIIAPSVWDEIAFSPRNLVLPEQEVGRMVEEAMGQAGIGHLRDKICHYLSEGERREVALAGALGMKPELLILDEPLEGLDPKSRMDLISLFNLLHAQGRMTIVMTTHDVNLISHFADSVYMLVKGGEIVSRGSPRDIFDDADRGEHPRMGIKVKEGVRSTHCTTDSGSGIGIRLQGSKQEGRGPHWYAGTAVMESGRRTGCAGETLKRARRRQEKGNPRETARGIAEGKILAEMQGERNWARTTPSRPDQETRLVSGNVEVADSTEDWAQ